MSRRSRKSALLWGVLAGVCTSATGIAINVATDFKDNVFAWLAVSILTVIGGAIGAAAGNRSRDSKPKRVSTKLTSTEIETVNPTLRPFRPKVTQRVVTAQGLVMRSEVEIRPDGTRIERTEYFSEKLASEAKKKSDM
jgi:hypothetical protein